MFLEMELPPGFAKFRSAGLGTVIRGLSGLFFRVRGR